MYVCIYICVHTYTLTHIFICQYVCIPYLAASTPPHNSIFPITLPHTTPTPPSPPLLPHPLYLRFPPPFPLPFPFILPFIPSTPPVPTHPTPRSLALRPSCPLTLYPRIPFLSYLSENLGDTYPTGVSVSGIGKA